MAPLSFEAGVHVCVSWGEWKSFRQTPVLIQALSLSSCVSQDKSSLQSSFCLIYKGGMLGALSERSVDTGPSIKRDLRAALEARLARIANSKPSGCRG